MREILFRAKRVDNGEWVEGSYCPKKTGHYNGGKFVEVLQHLIIINMSSGGYQYADVAPETVCQYVGLDDKNGRKIFEGDIVGKYDKYRKEWEYGIVKYGEFNCSCCYGVYGWHFDREDIRDYKLYEVKGNIFDNPELIGE